tara:strand:- start:4868 stop:5503 length:636 start_codon:yes stop_codon:yes gene_type:complete
MEKIKNYSIAVLIIALAILSYVHFQPVDDVTIITEEKIGEVEEKITEVVRDTIFIETIIPGQSQPQRKEIVVDSTYKADYEQAIKDNDILKAKNLFLESISLDTWDGNLVDNKDIKIDGKFLTRGKLLEYKIDYKIKSDTLKFKPTIKYQHPKLTLLPGVKLTVPTNPLGDSKPNVEINLGIQGKKGNIISVGFDTEKRVTVGYNIALKIF